MTRRGVIYKWTNKINGKVYVGKTVDEIKRKSSHKKDRRNYSAFHKAIDKYGIDNFKYEVLFEITETNEILNSILSEKEKHYIKENHSNEREFGYNLTDGGDGVCGRFGELNPFYGHHHTEETKQKHSLFMKKRKQTEEEKNNRREALKKIKHTEEWNNKISKTLSQSVSAYQNGDLVGTYSSYKECANALHLPNIKGISKVICNINKTYYGYTFKKQNSIEGNTDNKKENPDNNEENIQEQ